MSRQFSSVERHWHDSATGMPYRGEKPGPGCGVLALALVLFLAGMWAAVVVTPQIKDSFEKRDRQIDQLQREVCQLKVGPDTLLNPEFLRPKVDVPCRR